MRQPMTPREKTTLALELVLATVLAFMLGGILHGREGLPLRLVLPMGELMWGAVVLYFLS
jgi:hypothetical protein